MNPFDFAFGCAVGALVVSLAASWTLAKLSTLLAQILKGEPDEADWWKRGGDGRE